MSGNRVVIDKAPTGEPSAEFNLWPNAIGKPGEEAAMASRVQAKYYLGADGKSMVTSNNTQISVAVPLRVEVPPGQPPLPDSCYFDCHSYAVGTWNGIFGQGYVFPEAGTELEKVLHDPLLFRVLYKQSSGLPKKSNDVAVGDIVTLWGKEEGSQETALHSVKITAVQYGAGPDFLLDETGTKVDTKDGFGPLRHGVSLHDAMQKYKAGRAMLKTGYFRRVAPQWH